jgi:5-formyltetrahydrofolate cyclo-ligase
MKLPDEIEAWRKVERTRLLAERIALPTDRRRAARTCVQAILAAEVPELRRAATIGFYWPFRGEVNLVEFVRELTGNNIRAALPVVVEKGRPLEFWRWEPGMAMRPGIWDIPVPAIAEPVEPDCLLVPLVGFDCQGFRLGYGGGYYDRTLAVMSRPPLAIGVGYAFQSMPTIQPQPFDQPMDAIVTEAGIRWHRRHVPGASRSTVASAEDDPNVEPIECSSPPCFMHEL